MIWSDCKNLLEFFINIEATVIFDSYPSESTDVPILNGFLEVCTKRLSLAGSANTIPIFSEHFFKATLLAGLHTVYLALDKLSITFNHARQAPSESFWLTLHYKDLRFLLGFSPPSVSVQSFLGASASLENLALPHRVASR